jgi:hypothetical protein
MEIIAAQEEQGEVVPLAICAKFRSHSQFTPEATELTQFAGLGNSADFFRI